jgi:hypothetical protein
MKTLFILEIHATTGCWYEAVEATDLDSAIEMVKYEYPNWITITYFLQYTQDKILR